MRTVYKYTLAPRVTLKLPEGAKLLCVAAQGRDLCLWAEVHTENAEVARDFEVFGTGQPIGAGLGYVGTAFMGNLVWHVYERV